MGVEEEEEARPSDYKGVWSGETEKVIRLRVKNEGVEPRACSLLRW